MRKPTQIQPEKPFPLKQYYLLYGGLGALIFYVLLFMLLVHTQRQALYNQYLMGVTDKARAFYMDIDRDLLRPAGITFEEINPADEAFIGQLHREISAVVSSDFSIGKVKVFSYDGLTLYDSLDQKNVGHPYALRAEAGFRNALLGQVASKVEIETNGHRFLEVYLPIFRAQTKQVVGILELYEDVTRFEKHIRTASQRVLLLPTIIFLAFNVLLFVIVAKADRLISDQTRLLLAIRHNMSKYLSSSAVEAICQAVSSQRELFRGDRRTLVILFSDIRGFTSYSEGQEPETIVKELNKIFQIQADIINAHGGVIDKFVGDEIMATFAVDQISAAAQAAIEIMTAIAAAAEVDFRLGIGIHTGEAVVGSLGTDERRDYTAIGDTINVGARLCSAAAAGEIVLSPEVFEKIDAKLQARFSEKRTLNLKGKARPMLARVGNGAPV